MRKAVLSLMFLAMPAPASAAESLFAQLVAASSKGDGAELSRLLSTKALSTSSATIGEGNRRIGGSMRHGVPAAELADKLQRCVVKQWRDTDDKLGLAYIYWECPTQRVPRESCYFYSYRAEMLDARYFPPNLYIGEDLSWDTQCGARVVAPPSPYKR